MRTTMKFLATGLLAGALTFVGCKSNSSAERMGDTTQAPPPADQGTTTGTTIEGQGTDPNANPGTGGSGNISKTKQSDDNLRMPREDPLRTPERESIRGAESEPGLHDNSAVDPGPGTGGSGFPSESDPIDESLNTGGNIDDTLRTPSSPADIFPEDSLNRGQLPERAR